MKFTHFLLCMLVVWSSALSEDTVINPRGARPIEHGYKAQDDCITKEWPMCTDEDWGTKCPSGCRVQGLMDKADHDVLKKIEKIRQLLDEGRKLHRSADQVSKTTYNYLRDRLTADAGNDNRYATLAEQLRQRIAEIKIKIERQLRLLDALKSQVKDQVIVMQKLEVDIDIKLRTCKGSCSSYSEFSVDKESYVAIDKQLDNLNSMPVQSVETVSSLGYMKSRPLKDVVVPSIYKSQPKQIIFGDVGQMKLSLEAEGSTAESAATVSKFPTVCETLKSGQKQHNGYEKRFGKCPTQTRFPMFSDKERVGKCPSACHVQGRIDITDENIYKHLRTICMMLELNQDITSKLLQNCVHFYGLQRKNIVQTYMHELRYVEFAERLHLNLTSLQKKSEKLKAQLQSLHHRLWDQINEIHRIEVDIDIKIRASKGSCKQTFGHAVDKESYRAMQSQIGKFNINSQRKKSLSKTKRLKLQSINQSSVSRTYRKIPAIRTELLTKFEDIEQNKVILV